MIGDRIIDNKVVREQKRVIKSAFCKLYFQEQTTVLSNKSYSHNFKQNVTLKNYQILHQLNFKRNYMIYLLES